LIGSLRKTTITEPDSGGTGLWRGFAWTFAALLSLLPTAVDAKVGQWNGQDFLRYCVTSDPNATKPSDRDENDHVVYCDGYFEGALTAILLLNSTLVCPPRNARPADAFHIVVDRLRRHPEDKQALLATVIWNATLDTWRCK
jgi:Ssp1 endopeptidase immunity protein Rap1a